MKNNSREPAQTAGNAPEPLITKCLNCNQDYDQTTQGAICPHEVGGPNSLPPWPKPDGRHILGMEPDSVLRQIIRNYFGGIRVERAIGVEDIVAVAMQFNKWLLETNNTLQSLTLDRLNTTLPAPIIHAASSQEAPTPAPPDVAKLCMVAKYGDGYPHCSLPKGHAGNKHIAYNCHVTTGDVLDEWPVAEPAPSPATKETMKKILVTPAMAFTRLQAIISKYADHFSDNDDFDAQAMLQHLFAMAETPPTEWINEDELPEGYPYDEMFPQSKLGQDGRGGVRIFPKVNASSQGPAREETRNEIIERIANCGRKWMAASDIPHKDGFDVQCGRCSRRFALLKVGFDAGAKSVVAAPQNELLEELATVIDGYVGTHGCPEDAPCKQCVWANKVTDRWALYAEKNESTLAGAAALPSAQNQISQQGDSMKLIADENENGSTAEMVWLQHQIAEGRGEVRFGYTNDGDVGVWLGSEVNAAGAGDYAEDAIRIAMRRELPSPASKQS